MIVVAIEVDGGASLYCQTMGMARWNEIRADPKSVGLTDEIWRRIPKQVVVFIQVEVEIPVDDTRDSRTEYGITTVS